MSELQTVDTGQRERHADWGQALFATWILLFVAGAMWWMVDDDGVFFALGFSPASAIVTVPLMRPSSSRLSALDIRCPPHLHRLWASRSGHLSAHFDNSFRSLDELFLLGQEPEYFVEPMMFCVLALAGMTATFLLGGPSRRSGNVENSRLARYELRPAVIALCVPVAAVGLVAAS